MAARSSSKLKSGISLDQKVLNPVASSEMGAKNGKRGRCLMYIFKSIYIYKYIYLNIDLFLYKDLNIYPYI